MKGTIAEGRIKAKAIILKEGRILKAEDVEADNFIRFKRADLDVRRGIKTGILIGEWGSVTAGGNIKCEGPIICGRIEAEGNIEAGGKIEVDVDIKAGGNIVAKGDIMSATSIEAGGYIEVKGPYKIFAGLKKEALMEDYRKMFSESFNLSKFAIGGISGTLKREKMFEAFLDMISAKEVRGSIGKGHVEIISE